MIVIAARVVFYGYTDRGIDNVLVDNASYVTPLAGITLKRLSWSSDGNARVIQRRRSISLNWSLIRETGVMAPLPN